MDQRISGWRIWIWGVFALMALGLIVLFVALQGEGVELTGFNSKQALTAAFIILVAGGSYFLVRGRREEKTDLP